MVSRSHGKTHKECQVSHGAITVTHGPAGVAVSVLTIRAILSQPPQWKPGSAQNSLSFHHTDSITGPDDLTFLDVGWWSSAGCLPDPVPSCSGLSAGLHFPASLGLDGSYARVLGAQDVPAPPGLDPKPPEGSLFLFLSPLAGPRQSSSREPQVLGNGRTS